MKELLQLLEALAAEEAGVEVELITQVAQELLIKGILAEA
jgi:hypothetical protein